MIEAAAAPRRKLAMIDRLGVIISTLGLVGACLPFVVLRANRIVAGEPRSLLTALPPAETALLACVIAAGLMVALLRTGTTLRLVASLGGLLTLLVLIGRAGTHLVPDGDTLARASPATGFWLLLSAFLLLLADALTRLRPPPVLRVCALSAVAIGVAMIIGSAAWSDLSIAREYASREDAFWREAGQHLLLAFGSLAAAAMVGVPLGVLCYRSRILRKPILNILNMIQTIPSLALLGLLIAPLGWVAATVPAAAALGVAGIGTAPAMLALFGYSLLPMVANTLVGLEGVPAAANDAARGMGMTSSQRFVEVQFPLALPVILTGIRIVLVQNIGLATIAALIGGGGFGVFVFQGIGQAAMDLVLLGAIPTVALAVSAAVVLDAVVEATSTRSTAG